MGRTCTLKSDPPPISQTVVLEPSILELAEEMLNAPILRSHLLWDGLGICILTSFPGKSSISQTFETPFPKRSTSTDTH